MLKRMLYLGYYFKEMDWRKLKKFTRYVRKEQGRNYRGLIRLWQDMVCSSLRYNISLMDYFYFRFYRQHSRAVRSLYAGTGFLYEYQLKMNPRLHRPVLENKILFLNTYKKFVRRDFIVRKELSEERLQQIFQRNSSGKLVVKGSLGQVGAEVHVVELAHVNPSFLLKFMKKNRFDLLEDYVVQHPELMRLSPSGLNTVRVFTQLHKGRVYLLGARLRITLNAPVDNMAAGNMAAVIDLESGLLSGPAVFSDITRAPVTVHPVTGVTIPGFQVPHWPAVLKLVHELAFQEPKNRSVGWDIAISASGCEVIEGNHNWCKLLWQLPADKGLKPELLPFLEEPDPSLTDV